MNKSAAVIGAGFSGLLTAYELRKAGYDVTVFEKESYPGGQCLSLPLSGKMIELGCLFGTSTGLEDLCEDLKVETKRQYFYRQYLDNEGNKIPQLNESSIQKFKEEYKRLPAVLAEYYDCLNKPGLFCIPDSLKQDFLSWSRQNDIEILTEIFSAYFSCYGYGELDAIPAVYVLKHLDRTSLSALVESRKIITFPQGSSSLCYALAMKISDLRYNSEVMNIGNSETGKVSIKTRISTELFDRVIITAPISSAVVGNSFFSQVLDCYRTNSSNALLYRIPNRGLIDSFFLENAQKDGRLRLIHVCSSNSDYQIITAYSNGSMSIRDLDQSMRKTLSMLGVDSMVLAASKQWNFFPHVSTETLNNGFYETLDSRQGENGIYLGGALCCCSSLDKIIEFVPEYVRRYF